MSNTTTTKKNTKKTQSKPAVKEAPQQDTNVSSTDVMLANMSQAEMMELLKKLMVTTPTTALESSISPAMVVQVQSNTAGTLTYTSKRTGETIKWSRLGDENPMTVEELQTMRNTQRGFFKNNRIKLVGDNAAAVIKYLRVEEYFEDFVDLTNLPELFKQRIEDIVRQIEPMPQEAKTALAVAARRMISDGELRDIFIIKELSKAVDCDLLQE